MFKVLYEGNELVSEDGQWILNLEYGMDGRILMLKHSSNMSRSYFVKDELTWIIVVFNKWKVME